MGNSYVLDSHAGHIADANIEKILQTTLPYYFFSMKYLFMRFPDNPIQVLNPIPSSFLFDMEVSLIFILTQNRISFYFKLHCCVR